MRESDEKLKTVLELFDLEKVKHRLKTVVKRSIAQEIRNKNFGSRNFEKNAIREQNSVQRILGDSWQWETNWAMCERRQFEFPPQQSEELATTHFVKNGNPPECLFYKTKSGCRFREKCSHTHRQVDERLGIFFFLFQNLSSPRRRFGDFVQQACSSISTVYHSTHKLLMLKLPLLLFILQPAVH